MKRKKKKVEPFVLLKNSARHVRRLKLMPLKLRQGYTVSQEKKKKKKKALI